MTNRFSNRILCSLLAALAVWATISLVPTLSIVVHADSVSYKFTTLATLGDPVPGGYLINDFEPGGVNNRGDVIFGADIGTTRDPATGYGEAVYVLSAGKLTQLARPGQPAPGGGTFSFPFLARVAINDEGDGAFVFGLDPFDFSTPCCINAGLYRYSRDKGNKGLSAVVVPGQTPYPLPLVGKFPGVGFGASLSNRGDLAFTGVVNNSTDIFVADKQNRITAVLKPSDRPPGGGTFDGAGGPFVNQGGDVAFGAHLTGEAVCLSSIYVKKAGTGTITSIAHAGDPVPGGMLISAYSAIMNDSGDVVFEGLLAGDPCGNFETMGIYLHSGNNTIAIARPGDAMPGGGNFVTASFALAGNLYMNNPGEVVFNAKLDTDENKDNIPDTGLYLWSHGSLRLIARTGTVIPGLGTITELKSFITNTVPPEPSYVPDTGALNNDRGQVLFGATLADKSHVLLLATP